MAKTLTVLQMLPNPETYPGPVANPYTSLLVLSLDRTRVRTRYFSWKRSFYEPFDIVHFHWPEYMTRHKNPLLGALKCVLLAAFVLRLRLQKKTVIRTVHNLAPHESGTVLERMVLAWLTRTTSTWIVLNETTPTPDPARTRVLPHGHYRDWYQYHPGLRREGRIISFGLIRAYKGTTELIEAFRSLAPHYELHVAGKPDTPADGSELRRAIEGSSNVTLDLRFLQDDELARAISGAEAVALPYRAMHNSGAALLALSLNRPIIVPDSSTTQLLREEFGSEWVYLYEGTLTPVVLRTVLSQIRADERADDGPNMAERDWSSLGSRLSDIYSVAYETARRQHSMAESSDSNGNVTTL